VLVSVVFGYLLYVKTFSNKMMSASIRNIDIIRPKQSVLPSRVEILFDGKRVQTLSKANYIVWNSGRVPIDGRDVKSGIAIDFPDTAEILEVVLEKVSRDENRVRISPASSQRIACEFDFLDRIDGFNLGVLYSGTGTLQHPQATIVGMPKGIVQAGEASRFGRLLALVPGTVFFALLVSGFALEEFLQWPHAYVMAAIFAGFAVTVLTYWALPDWLSRPEPRKLLAPP
jgi:hypothetical protein